MTEVVPYLTSDRISNLPNNIKDDILMRLPMREAARTSVLSKAWRQRWVHIPKLVFDDDFLGMSQEVLRSTSCELIMKRVYEVLLLHCGPLNEFVLSISGLKRCPEIDRLILFLAKKDIQVFNLQIPNSEQHYQKLHSCLFSYLQLRYLKLGSFIFKPPPSFEGFSKLHTLYFDKVHFDADCFKKFISSCPLLAKLILHQCTEISCLGFNAPNLQFLWYYGIYRSICFENSPRLSLIYLRHSSGADPQFGKGKISNLFTCLHLESLFVDDYFLKNFAVSDASMKLKATWKHLKVLQIWNLCFVEEFLGALSLLRNSCNLKELVIMGFHDRNAGTNFFLQLLESDAYMDFSLNQLQKIVLKYFTGSRPQVELVKLLLAKSSTLKVMHIKISAKVAAEERLRILKDLLRAKRASLEAEIICEDL